ncbi:type II toxin-antitoxin system HipA family toxin [Hydrogenophaga sp.]|uniref:type II toxin-antitoxin system HipA family toxin n=1 Tax=Hydrogenophaga sp. TaxID=1904254 RepID=UPI0027166246|nr:type II toxin-antitoxin system HipA family toxin [Hydrogenophaga sp.]MDO9434948.1 type II toxin-antitoxin system HipA family toxin [Hydrogenophaga sp.]
MGRRSHTQTLSLWSNGIRVGEWSVLPDGSAQLRYDPAWVDSSKGRPVSLSLPFLMGDAVHKGPAVENYFDNLLPENLNIRKRLASRFKADSTQAFDMLKALGRDCVGALQLLGETEEPDNVYQITAVPLDESEVEHLLLRASSDQPLVGDEEEDGDLRISLAGVQEKTALLRLGEQWYRPTGATPTSHIFKLPLGLLGHRRVDFTHSVDNEWLCLRLLSAFGLDAATADIGTFGQQRVLIVERFDRTPSDDRTWLLRLPQEDFCQVHGLPSSKKYENEGGPGLFELSKVLDHSQTRERDLATLLKAQLLFWMLRATDGHAKNFSIALLGGGAYQMTPLYDVMSAWPAVGAGDNQWPEQRLRLAMAVLGKSKHYRCAQVQRRHFNQTARKVGYGNDMESLITETLDQVEEAIAAVTAVAPPDLSNLVAKRIFKGLRASAEQLRRMAPE